jgi:hypothetical protein
MEKFVLEPSTNTHSIEGEKLKVTELNNAVLVEVQAGEGLIKHGEHGTIKTEEPFVLKINQQEFNPIKKIMQNAID